MPGVVSCLLALSLLANAHGYGSLREVFTAVPEYPGQGLPRDAMQYIIDVCGLEWSQVPRRPFKSRPMSAALSPSGEYCVLSRPYPCDGCEGPQGAIALVDTSGLLWSRPVRGSESAVVSDGGSVAVFTGGARLAVLSVDGDTLLTRRWEDWTPRSPVPFSREICGFSEDGNFLLLTKNTKGEGFYRRKYVTILTVLDLRDNTETIRNLGAYFRPQSLETSAGRARLSGKWGYLQLKQEYGHWDIVFSPFRMEKHVTHTYMVPTR